MLHPANPRIQNWVNRGDRAIAELSPLHEPLNDVSGTHRHKRTLMCLSTAILGSTGTVLHLTEAMRLWDAELLMRSVVEGTVKFAYLLESPATFVARSVEYSDVLTAVGALRRHNRALEVLKTRDVVAGDHTRSFSDMLLSEEELKELRAAYPREMRRDVERRWGFTALIEAVSKPGGSLGADGRALLLGYSIASDLQHMSSVGIELALERSGRDDTRRTAVEAAHAAKLVSDSYHLAFFRVLTIFRFLGRPRDALEAVRTKNLTLVNELHEAEQEWEKIEFGPITPEGTGD